MTYQEALNYLFEQLPMFSRIGVAAYKKDITNTVILCKALGDPHNKFKSIHVAGTNGKGSVSHMLASVFQTAGYKTGLYTSPHLYDFKERIKVNGKVIDPLFVVEFVQRIHSFADDIKPSFFEITVAMAFDYFAVEKVDIAIIETGLGGRLDSTNIIVPELSVITNIGYDHMHILGDTLGKIAFEKAGIIKQNIPVIIGESATETDDVFKSVAINLRSPLYFADKEWYVENWALQALKLEVQVVHKSNGEHLHYLLDLPGIYQRKNLLTVLASIHVMKKQGWKLNEVDLQKGLSSAKKLTGLHGRWELIHTRPDIYVDVAHNEDGIKQLVEQIELMTYAHLYIVLGVVKDKEVDKMLMHLPRRATYLFTKANIPRALPEDELMLQANAFGLQGKSFTDINIAIQEIRAVANPEKDLAVVCGSAFIAGEIIRHAH